MTRAFFLFPRALPAEPVLAVERVLTPLTPCEIALAAVGQTTWRVCLSKDGQKWFTTWHGPEPITITEALCLLDQRPHLWVEVILSE